MLASTFRTGTTSPCLSLIAIPRCSPQRASFSARVTQRAFLGTTSTSSGAASPRDNHAQATRVSTPLISPRHQATRDSKPFSEFLTDSFARQHDYLRISITEKCNLRCLYCMPEEGVPLSPKKHLLTRHEILYLSSLFVSQGVSKIRLTGGEPTIHPEIMPMLKDIGQLKSHGLKELALTTNGLTLPRKIDAMVDMGVTGINLSLDTLDPFQFEIMTRRRGFDQVMKSIDRILELRRNGAPITLKVNAVVIRGLNDHQILPFVEMTRDKDLEIRFIEYMPFDGNKWSSQKMLSYQEMLAVIKEHHPGIAKVQDHPNDTSKTYSIPGFTGRLGFITSMTDHFCGTCNRLRITSDGNLKVCLFGNAEVSLRDMLRQSFNRGEPIDAEAWEAMQQVEMGRAQGKTDGPLGVDEKEAQLLDVIGMAVKRKKAKHAGIGQLEHMKNRPMILIDQQPPWRTLPLHLLNAHRLYFHRLFSTSTRRTAAPPTKLTHLSAKGTAHLVHISESKPVTQRTAIARAVLRFSNSRPLPLIRNATSTDPHTERMKKGDVLAVTRIAGIIGAKKTSDLIPLCHNIPLSGVVVDVDLVGGGGRLGSKGRWGVAAAKGDCEGLGAGAMEMDDGESDVRLRSAQEEDVGMFGGVVVTATVHTVGQTGVEMEALTAATVAGLTAYDMCKAVDKGMEIGNVRVMLKDGGKSGTWIEGKQDERFGNDGKLN